MGCVRTTLYVGLSVNNQRDGVKQRYGKSPHRSNPAGLAYARMQPPRRDVVFRQESWCDYKHY